LAEYERPIEVDSTAGYSETKRAYVVGAQRKYEEALAECERAIAAVPNSPIPYNTRGLIYRDQRQYVEALAEYERAIEVDPTDVYSYTNRAYVFRAQRKYGEALAECERALKIDFNSSVALSMKAEILIESRESDKAIMVLRRALELNPDNDWIHCLQGLANSIIGKTGQAARNYQEAKRHAESRLAANPRDSRVQFNLALYYLVTGDQEKAWAAYKRGVEICTEERWFKCAIEDLEMLERLELDIQGISQMKELLETALATFREPNSRQLTGSLSAVQPPAEWSTVPKGSNPALHKAGLGSLLFAPY
jgi:tetratricopeptide (TPR) repeat protein